MADNTFRFGITTSYISNRGPLFAAQEVVSNHIDAGGSIEDVRFSKDKTTLTSGSAVLIEKHHVTCLGETTKADNDTMIGHFGEGLKLAAVIALRNGGSCVVATPSFTATYFLKDEIPNLKVLHVRFTSRSSVKSGTEVRLCIPNSDLTEVKKRYLPDHLNYRLIKKQAISTDEEENKANVYCRGVFVCKGASSSYDWNLSCETNRDRTVPSAWSLHLSTCEIMSKNLADPASSYSLDYLFKPETPKDFELDALCSYGTSFCGIPTAALTSFHSVYGPKALVSSTVPARNEQAQAAGYRVIDLDNRLRPLAPFPEVDKVFDRAEHKEVPAPSWASDCTNILLTIMKPTPNESAAEAAEVDGLLTTLKWFTPGEEDKVTCFHKDGFLWLSTSLNHPVSAAAAALTMLSLMRTGQPSTSLAFVSAMFCEHVHLSLKK
jgi:hypothetical protein